MEILLMILGFIVAALILWVIWAPALTCWVKGHSIKAVNGARRAANNRAGFVVRSVYRCSRCGAECDIKDLIDGGL